MLSAQDEVPMAERWEIIVPQYQKVLPAPHLFYYYPPTYFQDKEADAPKGEALA